MLSKKLQELIKNPNIADDLDEDHLREIGEKVVKEMEEDDESRHEWKLTADRILKIAQVKLKDKKTFPWTGAANIKYPLITTVVLNFAARTYPELIKNGSVVQCAVVGQDPQGLKAAKAKRVGDYMSYQLLLESPDWEENTDKLLHVYPTIGVAFKKTYYDPIKKRNISKLCLHDEIIVNDNIESLESALRISHILKLSNNTMLENMRSGLYCEIPFEEMEALLDFDEELHEIVEQHRFLDLDDDNYEEPYIVTVHRKSKKVLRIVARFDPDGCLYNEKTNKVVRITPVHYFTAFHCIPRRDGKFHSDGLGTLLLHINEVINGLSNQIVNAGTLATTQGGFIGNKAEIQGGNMTFQPGEFKRLKILDGSALKDQILPFEFKDPSGVLYNMLELFIDAGKSLGSNTDVSTGAQPAQNVPATTIQVLDQNSKLVFTAMQRRLYRSLKDEFEKLYRLNRLYLDDVVYFQTMSDQAAVLRSDFEEKELDIRPVSDPNISSHTVKMAQAQFLGQFLQQPGINVGAVEKRMMEAADIPNPEELLQQPAPPPPNPAMLKIQAEQQQHQVDSQLEGRHLDLKQQEIQIKAAKVQSEIANKHADSLNKLATAQSTEEHTKLAGKDQQLKEHALGIQAAQVVGNIVGQTTKAHLDTAHVHLKAQEMKNNADSNAQRLAETSSDQSTDEGTDGT